MGNNVMRRVVVRGQVSRYEFGYPAYGMTIRGSAVETDKKVSIYLNLGTGEQRPSDRYTHLGWNSVREQVAAILANVPPALHPKAAFHLRGWDPLLNTHLLQIMEQLLVPAETRVVVTTPLTKGTDAMFKALSQVAAKSERIGLEIVPLGFTDKERDASSGTREMYHISTLGGYAETWAKQVKKFRPVVVVRYGVDYLLPGPDDWRSFGETFQSERCVVHVEPSGGQLRRGPSLRDAGNKLVETFRKMGYPTSLSDPEAWLEV